jgi:hypothetical protein
LELALNGLEAVGNCRRTPMSTEATTSVRPLPFTRDTLADAQRYYAMLELVSALEEQVVKEAAIRGRGRPGMSRRALLLNRSLHYGRRMLAALKPLAGLEGP